MNKKASPATGVLLPYADFINRVNNSSFAGLDDVAITAALKKSGAGDIWVAAIKELILRITGLSLFDSQLCTAYSLMQGRIAELPTGEGKTLAAVVAAVCYVLKGHRVHVLVFNDYLAKRDWKENHHMDLRS